ncbi:hypothetical protein ACRAWF_40495 [Streptomyces sp. L7]
MDRRAGRLHHAGRGPAHPGRGRPGRPDEPLTREKLCPVLAVLRAGSEQQGFALAADMVAFHGQGHSSVIHTEDTALAEEFRQAHEDRSRHRQRAVLRRARSAASTTACCRSLRRLRLWGGFGVQLRVSTAQLLNVQARRRAPGASSGSRSAEDLLRAAVHPPRLRT